MGNSQFNIYAKKGKNGLEFFNKSTLKEWIDNLTEGEDIVIKFNVSKQYKSSRQLRLLYSCFRQIAYHTGQSVEDIKLILKLKAGLCFSHTIEGESITVCKSLSDFSKREVSEFIQFTNEWSMTTLNLPLLTIEDKEFLKTTK